LRINGTFFLSYKNHNYASCIEKSNKVFAIKRYSSTDTARILLRIPCRYLECDQCFDVYIGSKIAKWLSKIVVRTIIIVVGLVLRCVFFYRLIA